MLPLRSSRTHRGGVTPATFVLTDVPPVVGRRWNDTPLAADTSMNACAEPASSEARNMTPAFAQAPSAEYTPEVGQSGKDVVWVPSPQELVDKMLDMAKVTPRDYLIDLGSGDGRTVITAAKRGARALGVEFNPDMVALSRRNAAKAGVSDKASFVEADIFRSDLSPATVITLQTPSVLLAQSRLSPTRAPEARSRYARPLTGGR